MARGPQRSASALGTALELGLQLGGSVVVGVGLGYYLDRWLGTSPVFLLVFLLFGFAAGIRTVVRFAAQAEPPGDSSVGSSSEGDARKPREFED